MGVRFSLARTAASEIACPAQRPRTGRTRNRGWLGRTVATALRIHAEHEDAVEPFLRDHVATVEPV